MSIVGCVNLLAPPSRLLVGGISLTSLFRATLLGMEQQTCRERATRINQALAHSFLTPPAPLEKWHHHSSPQRKGRGLKRLEGSF
jgi:hypothetical protein